MGDDHLLEILASCAEPAKLTRHLPKLFVGVRCFGTEGGRTAGRVTGLVSAEGEKLQLSAPMERLGGASGASQGFVEGLELASLVKTSGNGAAGGTGSSGGTIHGWLNELERSMRTSLAAAFAPAVRAMQVALTSASAPTAVCAAIEGCSTQLALLAARLLWTGAVEAALRG